MFKRLKEVGGLNTTPAVSWCNNGSLTFRVLPWQVCLLEIFLFWIRGGSLYISLSSGWFSIKCTDGLYCVTKGTFLWFLLKCRLSVCKLSFCEDFVYQIIWIASDTQVWSKILMFSSNVVFEQLALRSLRASPLINPFFTSGAWQKEKCVYWNVSVGLKCARMSKTLNPASLLSG